MARYRVYDGVYLQPYYRGEFYDCFQIIVKIGGETQVHNNLEFEDLDRFVDSFEEDGIEDYEIYYYDTAQIQEKIFVTYVDTGPKKPKVRKREKYKETK